MLRLRNAEWKSRSSFFLLRVYIPWRRGSGSATTRLDLSAAVNDFAFVVVPS